MEEGWVLLSAFESYWENESHAEIYISDNEATNRGIIAAFDTTQMYLFDSVFLLENNVVNNQSIVAHAVDRNIALFGSTSIGIVGNSAVEKSGILNVKGNITYNEDSVSIAVLNNTAVQESNIVILHHPLQTSRPKMSYYQCLFKDYEKQK